MHCAERMVSFIYSDNKGVDFFSSCVPAPPVPLIAANAAETISGVSCGSVWNLTIFLVGAAVSNWNSMMRPKSRPPRGPRDVFLCSDIVSSADLGEKLFESLLEDMGCRGGLPYVGGPEAVVNFAGLEVDSKVWRDRNAEVQDAGSGAVQVRR